MSSPFVAEIRIFPFNFPPTGWAFCNGQILPLSQNTALFSLLGTNYGGNGQSTFGLPNFQGSAAMFHGQGPGLSDRFLGETGGSPTVTLLQSEIPVHNHNAVVNNFDFGDANVPTSNALAKSSNASVYNTATSPLTTMSANTLATVGGGQPHNNMQPYLALNFCIALQGIYPPRP
jgi:microcystin-dependent protein